MPLPPPDCTAFGRITRNGKIPPLAALPVRWAASQVHPLASQYVTYTDPKLSVVCSDQRAACSL